MNYWEILGIERTNDKKTIKRAYAKKSREVHPEEHPEEFKRLHEAYEYALEYANEIGLPNVVVSSEESHTENIDLESTEEENLFDSLRKTTEEIPEVTEKETSSEEENLFDSLKKTTEEIPEISEEESSKETHFEDKDYIDFEKIFEQDAISYFEEVKSLTNKSLEELDKLYKNKVKKFGPWDEVCKSDFFCEAGLHPYFVDSLTQFTKEREDLPKNFYRAVCNIYKFEELKTRENKGNLTGLYELFESRGRLYLTSNPEKSWSAGIFSAIPVVIIVALNIARTNDAIESAIIAIFAVLFVLGLIVYIVRKIKNRKTDEDRERDRKNKEESLTEISPTWKLSLHLKRNQYYSKGVPLVANLAFLYSILCFFLYDDTASILISLLVFFGSIFVILFTLTVNIIIFIRSKRNKNKPVSLSKKKSFVVIALINVLSIILVISMLFSILQ
ncbi:MAG: J domain-containing protein [Oscillospiraceae bacterium]|nr:J domain-containing protein [Oscillospiraceae bacterium]